MASTETIRRISIRGDGADSLNALRDALLGVSSAQQRTASTSADLGQTSEQSARRITSTVAAFEGVERRANALARPMQQVAKDLNAVIGVMQTGGVEAGRVGTVIDSLKTKLQSLGTVGAIDVDQSGLNALLGLTDSVAKSARDAADVFDTELSRMEEVAKLRAAAAGEAFRDGLNRSLGIGGPSAASSGATYSALEAEMQRLAVIDSARAGHVATSSQQDINDLFGIGGRSASQSGATISALDEMVRKEEELAAAAAALRAQIDPLGAAFDRLQAELAQYQAMAAAGVITQHELGAASTIATARFDETAAQLQAVGRAGQMSSQHLVGMQYQMNDVAVSLASGQSPFTVLMQQGMQLSQMFAPGTTLAKAGTDIAAGFVSMLNPINLAVIGVAGLAGGVALLWDTFKSDSPTIEDSLKRHADLVRQARDAYGEAAGAAEDYGRRSIGVANLLVDAENDRLRKQLANQSRGLFTSGAISLDRPNTAGASTTGIGAAALITDMTDVETELESRFEPFRAAILKLREEAQQGRPDIIAFQQAVKDTTASEAATEAWRKAGGELVTMTDQLAETQRRIEGTTEAARRFAEAFHEALNPQRMDGASIATTWLQDFTDARREAGALVEEARRGLAGVSLKHLDAELAEIKNRFADIREEATRDGSIGAKGPQIDEAERLEVEAARRRETERQNDALRESQAILRGAQARLSNAGLDDYARGLAEINQRYDEMIVKAQQAGNANQVADLNAARQAELAASAREVEAGWARSMDEYGRHTDQMAGEAALLGKSTYEIERYRAAMEMLTQARQNDGVVTAEELARLEMEASRRAAVAQSIETQRQALEQTRELQRTVGEMGLELFKGAREGADGFADSLRNVLDRLDDLILQAIFLGEGPLAGLFNTQGQGGNVGGLFGALFKNPIGAPSTPSAGVAANANVAGGAAPVAAVAPVGVAAGPVPGSPDDAAYGALYRGTSGGGAALPGAVEATRAIVERYATQYGTDPNLALAVMTAESRGNQSAISPAGAIGRMQLMPGTAGDLGVNPYDPEQNIAGGVRYLDMMGERYGGDTTRTLAAYNWGPGNVDKWNGDMSALPAETRDYIARVNSFMPQAAAATEQLGSTATNFTSDFDASLSNVAAGTQQAGGGFVNNFNSALSNITSGVGGSSSSGGGLFDWIGGLFGGGGAPVSTSSPTSSFLGLYDTGGYTGPGGRHQPAGVVHRGEVVWSQDDVARAGGVGAVEAMRLGMRGYAAGGYAPLNDDIPAMLRHGDGGGYGGGGRGEGGPTVIKIEQHFHGAKGDQEVRRIAKEGTVEALNTYRKKGLQQDVVPAVNSARQRRLIK